MRISDWSSDVGSSDLRAAPGGEIAVALIGREIVLALHAALRPDADPVELVAIAEFAAQHVDLARRQIGVAGRLRIGPALHVPVEPRAKGQAVRAVEAVIALGAQPAGRPAFPAVVDRKSVG